MRGIARFPWPVLVLVPLLVGLSGCGPAGTAVPTTPPRGSRNARTDCAAHGRARGANSRS